MSTSYIPITADTYKEPISDESLDNLEKRLLHEAQIIKDLHTAWMPHEGQIKVGKSLFYEGKQFIFTECGRKWGKTEFVCYALYRLALTTPLASCYFIAPFQKQAKELIWANGRIQHFLPPEIAQHYVNSINNTEMRITFKNGSFIKLDGADNHEAYRGINPHAVAYDEFKDHDPRFHEGMEPNLAPYRAPCIFIGTPPESDDNHFVTIADSVKDDLEDGAYFNMPSWTNPHIDKKWLKKTKERLMKRGELDVWMREYEAQRVKGGKNAIFPMFDDEKHIFEYKTKLKEIRRSYKDWDFLCSCDPATSSVFGVLFTAIHKYSRKVFHLKELYVDSTRETSARNMWAKIEPVLHEIHPIIEEWTLVYDEAAKWFENEIMDLTEGDIYFQPTQKKSNKKDDGLSLIKDQMAFGFWFMSNECKKTRWEIVNYIKDEKSRIPKENDHNIDNMRYINAANYYTAIPSGKPDETRDPRRFYTMADDYDSYKRQNDWTSAITSEYYE